jgi:hypothetical protein
MCLSGCTILNEVFPIIGIIGIFLILMDYKIFGKKFVKTRNILMTLTIVFVIAITLGATTAFSGRSCNFFVDIILCKYLRITCMQC